MELENVAELLKIIGHPTRLKILQLLKQNGELCVCELLPLLEVSQPNLSQHLSILKLSGLVENNKVGNTIRYRLSDNKLLNEILEIVEKHTYSEVNPSGK
ncbi:ArsR family transcriptional regulator [Fervidobacterium sp. SC_NGM5_O18]|uniref:ArsR family transcriptional regulator n=2 Tax=Fervidobacterium pennivorans TaxID=93466 RepID=A0A172T2F8_FERPE|nr:metalloregulator ArsR/SmtB family transcription factor [Fervidobacterium pennivorans]ANE41189.1 ArsR family transcriptional regulator [Fervidobacterium pennivorans]PHJ12395.1 ArsR family transcriptional regulator [Fervidobacterium sp. SC_NGM5_O18]QIV77996.1 winged helix-turn-helix transcriptional regulator [Fervidobacterium pennivorans subsp. keratinolyticus]